MVSDTAYHFASQCSCMIVRENERKMQMEKRSRKF